MVYTSLRDLPQDVLEEITDEKYLTIDRGIYDMFGLTSAQIDTYADIFNDIVLGRHRAIDVPDLLARFPDKDTLNIREFALSFAIKRLWPLQDFLGDVDALIRKLNGTVPQHVPLPQVVVAEEPEDEEDLLYGDAGENEEWIQGAAKDVIQSFREYNDYYLTQKPIYDMDGRLKPPTVANWIADYLHTMGAEGAGSLKRSQYLAKSGNVHALNESEKRNLLNFFISYEQGDEMFWHVAEGQFLLVEPDLPEDVREAAEREQSTQQMSDLVEYYRNVQNNYHDLFEKKKQELGPEVADDTRKLSDIAWDALGILDVDRCMAAFDMLIDRHALWDILKTDQRFRGIFTRFLDATYGTEAKNLWNGDLTSAVATTLFWKLILAEKLGLEENKAAIIADYFSKKSDQKERPVYLDLKLGRFVFREVVYKDRALSFA